MVNGIRELFIKYKITGWEEPYATLKKQLEDYDKWVRDQIIPKGRADFRMTPEKYKLALEEYGIDIPPAEIASMAHLAFNSIQNQMKRLAEQIAKKYNLSSSDYRSVIQYLKKDQIIGDSILPLYESHLKDIEKIIRKQELVTLPDRPAIIKLATAAESARQPAPIWCLHHSCIIPASGAFLFYPEPATISWRKTDKYDDFTLTPLHGLLLPMK
jgi:hypothetical protein